VDIGVADPRVTDEVVPDRALRVERGVCGHWYLRFDTRNE
jgi:hypothetical protein